MKRDPYEDLYDENLLNSGRHQHYFNENYVVMKIYRFDKNHFFMKNYHCNGISSV